MAWLTPQELNEYMKLAEVISLIVDETTDFKRSFLFILPLFLILFILGAHHFVVLTLESQFAFCLIVDSGTQATVPPIIRVSMENPFLPSNRRRAAERLRVYGICLTCN